MKKSLPVIMFCSFFMFLMTAPAFSANEYFRSNASGNWNAISTWQMSTNNGSTWVAATLTPNENSGLITVRYPNTVTVTVSVSADQLTIDSGTVSISAAVVLTLLDGSGNDLTVLKGGTVTGAGTFRTQGAGTIMDLRTGSNFNAALKVNTGTTAIGEYNPPYNTRLYGSVTIDAGATLNTNNSPSYTLFIYKNLTNNGSITGAGGSNVRFLGAALLNAGSISVSDFYLDSTSTIAGTGTWTGTNIEVGINGNVSLLNNVTFALSQTFSIITGGVFSANSFIATYSSGSIELLTGGTVANSGTIRTQNSVTINVRTGSNFNANLNVNTGTTTAGEYSPPYNGRLYGSVTIDAGATVNTNNSPSYTLFVYGNLTNNGSITGAGGSNLRFFGAALSNSGSIAVSDFFFDSTSTIAGTGTWTGTNIDVGVNGNVSLLNNVTFAITEIFSIKTGGVFSANSFIATYTSGTIEILTGGTVSNSGTIRTQNTVTINARTGSGFNANLNINTGTTNAGELSPPYNGRLYGNVTVSSGAILNTNNSPSYTLFIYGNLINNGTITGAGGSNLRFFGATLTNSGSVTVSNFNLDSTTAVSGFGTWTGTNIYIGVNGNVSLMNNVTFAQSQLFSIKTGGMFSANTFTATFTTGTIEILTGGTVANSGIVWTQGSVNLNPRTGSSFNANLRVISGTTIAAELASPYNARLYGNVTVDAGSILSVNNSPSYTLMIFGNVINNGTISGTGDVEFQSGAHTLLGTGIITTDVNLISGAVVTLLSGHQFSYININTGATFDISNRLVKFTLSNPIVQNGTFITAGSDIEYKGTSFQNVSYLNIIYVGLKINNPAGVVLQGNIVISDTLSMLQGDLNLNGKIITFTPDGYLSETSDHVVFGNTGHLTTTRTLGAPTALNVAGFGAILTTSVSLGSTQIIRGHTTQSGLNSGTSIQRYYDITPATNSGLNATLVYSYSDTELNGKPEPSLKLFKSTNSGTNWQKLGGTVNVSTNRITLSGLSSFSRWTADSSGVSALVTIAMEAFYNPANNRLNMADTLRAYLRNSTSPYAVVDSAKEIVNFITLRAGFQFNTATTGTYFLQIKHRNSIETWSNTGLSYTAGNTMLYDFTTGTNKAFGNNQTQVDASPLRFAVYSGDVNQDGTVDIADGGLVDNDASAFVSGYVPTDVNGDSITDIDDAVYVDNNGLNFIGKITP